MEVKDRFEALLAKMSSDPSHLGDLNVVYQFNFAGNEDGVYQLKISDKQVEFVEEKRFEPQITLEMSEDNFLNLIKGDLNPTMAYMSGKLKVRGDLSLALKLHGLLKKYQ
ncbi:SCP2 sterol-binding domain-containing protein [Evansella tamaricis]|uniref:SCP2 sterol-binding domain-containing protein n=1 Tax=Evansella tamaricis TaxID=2069301 RepID=A0ABS6J9H7_9BACI|nr:SCP2 sterol-binding domain-containing protein [Evansella tamaricis]MBU9710338.1 SCP2 sterol-binding domain-containing protein [Evansella tamaricis]